MKLNDHIQAQLTMSPLEIAAGVVRPLYAGGPGSGRRPGFGEGRHPGGRPFGVKSGVHKVLTDAGFQYKGGTGSLGSKDYTSNLYKHPQTGHSISVTRGDSWKHADEKGTGTPYGRANGKGAAALKEHLQQYGGGNKMAAASGFAGTAWIPNGK